MPPSPPPSPAEQIGETLADSRNDVTIERAPVGIAHFDPQGRFLFVNPRLCSLFGFSREELLAMTFQDISFAEDLPHCLEMIGQVACTKDGHVEIAIADTGRGIPPEQVPVIFRRYWHADHGSHRGVGLGLAIVKGIIDAHGDTIAVTSTVGE